MVSIGSRSSGVRSAHTATAMRLRFGDFVLDTSTRQLLRGAAEVRLGPKPYALLELLVSARPRALSKAEILARVWPDVAVADGSLASAVAELRAALDDDAQQPRLIRTLYAFGYAFCGEVTEPTEAGASPSGGVPRVIWEGRVVPLSDGENLLGRGEDVRVRIDVPGVSRRHARIVVRGDRATLEDLGSKNGTFIDEQAVTAGGCVLLLDGARFRLGRVGLTYRCSPETGSTATDRPI